MFTSLRSLLGAFGRTLSLMNPDIQRHHERTAYVAYQIVRAMELGQDALFYTTNAALMHEIGCAVLDNARETLTTREGRKRIAKAGAYMLRDMEEFQTVADIIEISQDSYAECLARGADGDLLDIAQAIRLADFVSAALREDVPALNQVKGIVEAVTRLRGVEFSPKVTDAFLAVSKRECMWMDAALNPSFLMNFTGPIREVSLDKLVIFTRFMSRIIDFRSPFTAMHSAGVAATARELARLAGMSKEEIQMIAVAGNLHDVGKVRVPNAILEKPGGLTEEEFNAVKEHAYYTRIILKDVEGFEKIADWAAFHHEKLNGEGYPFHLDGGKLDTGSRIMAVADIFAAITETRPYRVGMGRERAMAVLEGYVSRGEICGRVVGLLREHYDEVDAIREKESRTVGRRYYESLEIVK